MSDATLAYDRCRIGPLTFGELAGNPGDDDYPYEAVYVRHEDGRTWRLHASSGDWRVEDDADGSEIASGPGQPFDFDGSMRAARDALLRLLGISP